MHEKRMFGLVLGLAAGAVAVASPPAAAIARGECCSSVNGVCISVCARDSCTGNGDCKLAKTSTNATSDTPGIAAALRTLEASDQAVLRRLLAANDADRGSRFGDGSVRFVANVATMVALKGVDVPPELKSLAIDVELEEALPAAGAAGTSGRRVAHIRIFDGANPTWTQRLRPYLLGVKERALRIDEIQLRSRDGRTIALRDVRIVAVTEAVPVLITVECVFVAS